MNHLRKMGDVLKRKEVMLKSENEKDRCQLRGRESKEQEDWQGRRLELAECSVKPVNRYKKGEMIALIFLRPCFQDRAKHG